VKKLTFKEFQDRTLAIAKARKIFIKSGLTTNITHAFELYQEVLADEQRDIMVSAAKPLPFDAARHKCPICGKGMLLGTVNTSPRNQVGDDYNSQWYCPHCDESVFNKETVNDILRSAEEA